MVVTATLSNSDVSSKTPYGHLYMQSIGWVRTTTPRAHFRWGWGFVSKRNMRNCGTCKNIPSGDSTPTKGSFPGSCYPPCACKSHECFFLPVARFTFIEHFLSPFLHSSAVHHPRPGDAERHGMHCSVSTVRCIWGAAARSLARETPGGSRHRSGLLWLLWEEARSPLSIEPLLDDAQAEFLGPNPPAILS